MVEYFFLPQRCLVCGGDLETDSLCVSCRARLQPHGLTGGAGRCPLCGQVRLAEAVCCVDCSVQPWSFSSLDGLYGYQDTAGELLRLYKFHGLSLLAALWAPVAAARLSTPAPIVPVPALRRHRWRRGWDPVGLLTRQMAQQASVPLWKALTRRASASQKSLGRPERQQNAQRAYALAPGWRRRLRGVPLVWLVDDVVTTGATIEVCAALLREAGVAEVRVFCVVLH